MSCSLEIVAKAKASLAELDPWLQEEVLDEIDRLAREPDLLVRRGVRPGLVHDFQRARERRSLHLSGSGTRYGSLASFGPQDRACVTRMKPAQITFPPNLQFVGDVQQSPARLHGQFIPDSVDPRWLCGQLMEFADSPVNQ